MIRASLGWNISLCVGKQKRNNNDMAFKKHYTKEKKNLTTTSDSRSDLAIVWFNKKNNTLLYIPLNTKESLYQTFLHLFSKLNLILIRIQSLIPSTDRPKQTKYYPLKREAWHTTHYSFFNLLRYSNNKVIIHWTRGQLLHCFDLPNQTCPQ